MTTLSHAAVGYLITRYLVSRGILPDSHTPYLLGVIFANLPDIDGAFALRRLYNHHNNLKSLSHYPANWLLVLGVAAIIALPYRLRYLPEYLLLAFFTVLFHFVLDTFSIYGGVAWLGPWKKKKYSFIRIMPLVPSNNHEWTHWYLKHWVKYLEVAIWIVALIILFSNGKS